MAEALDGTVEGTESEGCAAAVAVSNAKICCAERDTLLEAISDLPCPAKNSRSKCCKLWSRVLEEVIINK